MSAPGAGFPSNSANFGGATAPSGAALRPCKLVSQFATATEARHKIKPNHTKSAQRRRRLWRGVDCWDLDRQLCAEPTRRVALITLTTGEDDPLAMQGRAMAFWKKVRQTYIGTRYFCWLEVHKRGQFHYQAMWLNPPHRLRRDVVHWVDRWWGEGRTQVRFKDGRWANSQAASYVTGYAKKMGSKAYQQYYDHAPRELRTFMSQRLEIPPKYLVNHRDHPDYRYVPEHTVGGELIEEMLVLVGHIQHQVERGGYCTAIDHRRPKRSRAPPAGGPPSRTTRRWDKVALKWEGIDPMPLAPLCLFCRHLQRYHYRSPGGACVRWKCLCPKFIVDDEPLPPPLTSPRWIVRKEKTPK